MSAAERDRRRIWILFCAAVIARIAAAVLRGDGALRPGYDFYTTISQNFLDGHGLCHSLEGGCADRTPLYALWLAPFVATGTLYPGVAIAQALAGAALTWIAWGLGVTLFDRRTALIAAAAAAFSPYAVMHDTALQDTVFINVLIPLAMLLLLRARDSGSAWCWIAGGLSLALAVMFNARVVLLVPCALAWVVFAGGRDRRSRARSAILAALPVVVLVGGWMMRNWQVVGVPVLTTESGKQLWFANSAATFAYFPDRSIDLTINDLDQHLPEETRALLAQFPGSEVQRDAFVRRLGIDYMLADPFRTAIAATRKIAVAAFAQLSPARGALVQWGYAAAYLPIHLLAVLTLVRMRGRVPLHSLTWLLLLSFAVTTALFWAHTSHKSYLDAVLFVYAAAALTSWLPTRTAAVPA
jgi:4-amino-4-deoxy-L-arabinose transferase-like glycosyltransferase